MNTRLDRFQLRYLVPLLGLLAAGFALILIQTVRSQRALLESELRRTALVGVKDLARRGEVSLLLHDSDNLRGELRGILESNPDAVRAAFLDPNGTIVASLDIDGPWPPARVTEPTVVPFGQELVAISPVVDDRGHQAGVALIAIGTSRVREATRQAAGRVLAYAALGFGAVAWLAAILLGQIRSLATTLDQRVKQRTADLAAVTAQAERTALFAIFNPSPVIRFDPLGNVLWSNPEAATLLHQSVEDRARGTLAGLGPSWHGFDWTAIIDQDRREVVMADIGERTYQVTIRGIRAHGFGHAYLADVSDLKRTEADLAVARDRALDANRLKSEFLANMSHEIRTPMNGVVGMLGLLTDTELTPRQRSYLQTASTSAHVMLTVIDDILDFSKVEAGKLELERAPFDLAESIDDVAHLLAGGANPQEVELIAYLDPTVPTQVIGDSVRFRQILLNLGGNGVKFTARGEVIIRGRLAHRPDPGPNEVQVVRFEVQDTGIGMPDSVRGTLFQPFRQADSSTTRQFGGTGLGLSICRRLVELMGGTIGVESTEGVGSTFWFEIPLPSVELARPASPMADLTAVVVDPSAAVREALTGYLTPRMPTFATAHIDEAAALVASAPTPAIIFVADSLLPAVRQAVDSRPTAHRGRRYIALTRGATAPTGDLAESLPKPVRRAALERLLAAGSEASPRPSVVRPIPASTRPSGTLPRCRVLLAEDNEVNRLLAVEIFATRDVDVTVAHNGAEAVAARFNEEYDVVLMDCQMPIMDGLAATRTIRSREAAERRRPIRIVALTANAIEGDREACLAAGMDDYLAKPYTPAELLAVAGAGPTPPTPHASPTAMASSSIDPDHLRGLIGDDRDKIARYLKMYLDGASQTLAELREAMTRGDLGEVRRVAHKLKGSSGMVGAKRLATVAAELERAAAAGSVPDGSAVLGRLEAEFAAAARYVAEQTTA